MSVALLLLSLQIGRSVPNWSYEKLFKQADLVVIAKAVSTVEADAENKDKAPADYLKPVLTTFEVVHVIKGEHRDKMLAVLHYRLDPKAEVPDNGPNLVEFHRERLPISYGRAVMLLGPPEYLVFLKRGQNGRFRCVTGQYDPQYSVRQLILKQAYPDGFGRKKI